MQTEVTYEVSIVAASRTEVADIAIIETITTYAACSRILVAVGIVDTVIPHDAGVLALIVLFLLDISLQRCAMDLGSEGVHSRSGPRRVPLSNSMHAPAGPPHPP